VGRKVYFGGRKERMGRKDRLRICNFYLLHYFSLGTTLGLKKERKDMTK
jgi:hypothetical protein